MLKVTDLKVQACDYRYDCFISDEPGHKPLNLKKRLDKIIQ